MSIKSVGSDVVLIFLSLCLILCTCILNYDVVLLINIWKELLLLHYWQHNVICGINEWMTRRKCQAHPADFFCNSLRLMFTYMESLHLTKIKNPVIILYTKDYSISGLIAWWINYDSITFVWGSVIKNDTQKYDYTYKCFNLNMSSVFHFSLWLIISVIIC